MPDPMTIADAIDEYIADIRTEVIRMDIIYFATEDIKKHFGHVGVEDRSTIDNEIRLYIASQKKDLKSATIRRKLVPLRAALMRLWKNGRLSYRPYLQLPANSRPNERWLTPDEARLLIAKASPRIALFLMVALVTGARKTAMLELTWDRVDTQRGMIDFRAPHPLEYRRKRRAVVPVHGHVLDELRAARSSVGDEPRVFPFVSSILHRLFRAARRRAKLQGVTIHTLRHTTATWMLAGDVPLVKASKMLGHSSTAVTDTVYGHLNATHLRGIAEMLSAILAPKTGDG